MHEGGEGMLTDVLQVGDRVEIRILQEVLKGYKVSGKPRVFISKIFDIPSETDVILAMPVESSKVILLPKDVRYDLSFYSKKGLFNCTAEVKGRYKEGHVYSLAMSITSPLQKLQRRKFFRLDCLMDFTYYVLYDDEEKEMTDPYEAHEYHLRHFPDEGRKKGTIVDISGGGIRTVTDEPLPIDGELLVFFRVAMDNMEYAFCSFAYVVKCREQEKNRHHYESGLEFKKLDKNERERIVKYIFQEERSKRQNQKK